MSPRTGVSIGVPGEGELGIYDGGITVHNQTQAILRSFITSPIISMATLFVSGDSLAYL